MNVLLGITGGVSAYKSAELTRLLTSESFSVRVVMTQSAQEFIAPLTFQALSGHPVYTDLFDSKSDSGMDHIRLPRWADFILIAPASADFVARLAQGRANDLLTTICLAAEVPIAVAPAMNQQMWFNAATQENIQLLKQRDILCFGPAEGEQACGEFGPGRLLEPLELLEAVKQQFYIPALVGKKILITAGPTREAIDPIRYLTNRSSGSMGYALAESAARAGAEVTLVSGPVQLSLSGAIRKVVVNSALEMEAMVMSLVDGNDIFISAAAVSDYRPDAISLEKIKKTAMPLTLKLVRNPDILAEVARLEKPPFTVGFAAETQELLENAKNKLKEKNLDMIIANQVGHNSGFGDNKTSVTILTPDGNTLTSLLQPKKELAQFLIRQIAKVFLNGKRVTSDI